VGLPGRLALGRSAAPHEPGLVEQRTAEDLPSEGGTVTRVTMTAVVAGHAGGDVPADLLPEVVTGHLPTLRLTLEPGEWTAHWFVSDWGDEFTPRRQSVAPGADLRLEVTTGRSSKGMHPWLCLDRPDGPAVLVAPAWSGNWAITVVGGDHGLDVTAGISDRDFSRRIGPGRPFVAPPVYVAVGPDRAAAAAALAGAVSRWVVPRSAWSAALPVAWNHWWPYEDAEIDAPTFLADARSAAGLGLDVATLDAGWFGAADAATFWERVRGDWDRENTVRFPEGTAGLSARVRDLGLGFGIWCEVEAVGPDAEVARAAPEVLARRAGHALGYVCLGSPPGRSHVRGTLERLVGRTQARWLKVDFNLDPGAGCDRTDHGHDAGDGLYEHYRGLYAVLDDLRGTHPELLVEACSSGGLRIDLGLLGRVHCTFLSDPDWTEFHLQLLWGACHMLPAAAIFHFPESQWRTFHPLQNFDPATASVATVDTMLRSVVLHRFAVSWKLASLPAALQQRLAEHVTVHRRHAAPLIRDHGVIRPLTDQPLREGGGERFPAFQLTAGPARSPRALVAAFRLDGATRASSLRPLGLDPDRRYRVRLIGPGADPADVPVLGGQDVGRVSGADLLVGALEIRPAGEATSWLLALDPVEVP
jgi:alpha-galactosidase